MQAVADFTGDGTADVLWRHAGTGAVYLMPVSGGQAQPGAVVWVEPSADWRIVGAGDLDGDGRADLLLSLPDDDCGFDDRLYLSSMAGPGQLVGLAARFAGRHPACGC